MSQVIDDLDAEHDAIDALVHGLDSDALAQPSAAAGWSIADVLLHLAQTEEMVVATIAGKPVGDPLPAEGLTTDEVVDNWVNLQRGEPAKMLARWQVARRASVAALREADPDTRYAWIAATLRPDSLATTRIAEHWAHALDIAGPLGADYPDTDRLRHVAWLAHRTLPYAFQLRGEQPEPVYVELSSPDGASTWTFGEPDAPSRITGSAGHFCRVGAQRLRPEDSDLQPSGPHGAAALKVLRNYAG